MDDFAALPLMTAFITNRLKPLTVLPREFL